ncbi:MAG: hypothetical protein A2X42_10935 [Candidatus Margulisbacteria bacterium GWF2_38_17]|nr:MAG: hypothetical protein A2X42_10935 [Candidatus Margulisbacteria bacterium GWF2_38_17]
MITVMSIIIAFCLFMGVLFFIALKTEQGSPFFKKLSRNPLVYALSLGVYFTTWAFYGSVGTAATTGLTYLPIYLGPILIMFFGWFFLRKLVRIKNAYRITSIADFISARYGKSQSIAALVTVIILLGILPYISLQLKVIFSSFDIITAYIGKGDLSWATPFIHWLLIAVVIVFTIIFGARRLDPTERHEGMVLVIAIISVIKLVAFVAVGVFSTYFVFNGFEDILRHVSDSQLRDLMFIGGNEKSNYLIWFTYLILSMSAFIFLPRQFHVVVIENSNEKSILTAMWFFPIYILLLAVFVLPVAMGGLTAGLPLQLKDADSFVLLVPIIHGNYWLALGVFIGGLSAGVSMIIICSMTLATMVTNHLLLPVISYFDKFKSLSRHILKFRWLTIAVFIVICFYFEREIGHSSVLTNFGMVSFVAVFQFAPAIIGGLYWRNGNKVGARAGLLGGFIAWIYTLFIPALINSGWLASSILKEGIFGLSFLRPEALFGISLENNIVHSAFWSILINIGLYVMGSISYKPKFEEQELANSFVGIINEEDVPARKKMRIFEGDYIDFLHKREILEDKLSSYFSPEEASVIITVSAKNVGIEQMSMISVLKLSELQNELEKTITGYLGAATAHKIVTTSRLFTDSESKYLSEVYADVLATLKLPPEELIQKVDYYKDRERLLAAHSQELEDTIMELNCQIGERERVEDALIYSEHKHRLLLENLPQRIFFKTKDLLYSYCNNNYANDLSITPLLIEGKSDFDLFPNHLAEQYRSKDKEVMATGTISDTEEEYILKDTKYWVHTIKVPVKNKDGEVEGILGIFWDITDRKLEAEEIQQVNEELESRVVSRTFELMEANKTLTAKIKELEEIRAKLIVAYDDLQGTQSQLVQAEKLASIGQLAAGIAHEINTPTQYVGDNLSFLKTSFDDMRSLIDKYKQLLEAVASNGVTEAILAEVKKAEQVASIEYLIGEVPKAIDESLDGTGRIASIVKAMKEFSHPGVKEKVATDINRAITNTVTVARNEWKYVADVVFDFCENLPHIPCLPGEFNQVIINIVINAAHAIADVIKPGEKGTITIKTTDTGEHVEIRIQDTGNGIPLENRTKVFDPFFTTKQVGKGTGQGLAIARSVIVDKHDGTITLESEVGKGTVFVIRLPIA